MKLKLSQIVADKDVQPRRWGLHWPTVDEYVERLKAGDQFPDPVVYHDGKRYWLSEGFHRYAAHEKAGYDEIDVAVRQGGKDDAAFNATGSNKDHGRPRSNEDKWAATEKAVKLRPTWTDHRLAEHVGVSHTFVGKVRGRQLATDSNTPPATREGKDGKQYQPSKPKSAPAKKKRQVGTVPTSPPAPELAPQPAPPQTSRQARVERFLAALYDLEMLVTGVRDERALASVFADPSMPKWAVSKTVINDGHPQTCEEAARLRRFAKAVALGSAGLGGVGMEDLKRHAEMLDEEKKTAGREKWRQTA